MTEAGKGGNWPTACLLDDADGGHIYVGLSLVEI